MSNARPTPSDYAITTALAAILGTLAVLAGIYTGALSSTSASTLGGTVTPSAYSAPIATWTPEEDEPGWDCDTMGNRVCGPTGYPAGTGSAAIVPGESVCARVTVPELVAIVDQARVAVGLPPCVR